MKGLRDHPLARAAAAALLLTLTFAASMLALNALQALPYLGLDSWRNTEKFYQLRQDLTTQIAYAASLTARLEEVELSYVERQQLSGELEQCRENLSPSATNFRFVIRDREGNQVASNLTQGETLTSPLYYTALEQSDPGREILGEALLSPDAAGYTIEYATLPEEALETTDTEDALLLLVMDYEDALARFSPRLTAAAFCLSLAALSLLFLLWSAGHTAGAEEIALSWQEHIFLELYLAVDGFAGLAVTGALLYLLDRYYSYVEYPAWSSLSPTWLKIPISGLCVALAALAAALLRTLAVRLKARALARTSLLCRAASWLGRWVRLAGRQLLELARSLPLLWRLLAAFIAYFLVNATPRWAYNGVWFLLWLAVNLAVLLCLCRWVLGFQRLRKGGQALAAGNLDHRIDTHRLPHDLRCHAEDLNNISQGMAEAVEEQMKSERFRAELITNVSHDLKTPLTSIINYVDLLKTTQQTDPKAEEYIEVLDRKSQRLKKLTEDLVEASKASTGVLRVERERIGMAQLMDQALGEWTEKLEARRLSVITSLPDGETWVYADGRHLWRVLDNLLSNCAKYALEGTRIYLDLSRSKGQVTLSVKNISREPLNLPPERLMERFVRGEESRSTDGSGLGLSIARSLTELQGGVFELAVDGDLFKAMVTLPQAN